jgi:hypothetical protein
MDTHDTGEECRREGSERVGTQVRRRRRKEEESRGLYSHLKWKLDGTKSKINKEQRTSHRCVTSATNSTSTSNSSCISMFQYKYRSPPRARTQIFFFFFFSFLFYFIFFFSFHLAAG